MASFQHLPKRGKINSLISRIIAYYCGGIAAVLPIRGNISCKKKRKI